MRHTLATTLLLSIFLLPKSFAQTSLSVPIGEKLLIPIKVETASPCNLEITIAGKVEQRTIEPSSANFSIEFETSEIGTFEVKWEGRFRSRGLKSVPACSSSGLVKVATTANTEKRKEEWSRFFASLSADQSACVKAGLRQKSILFESIDPLARLESPSSSASREIFSKCDSFTARRTIWGANNKDDFPCTLRGGEKSRCRGVYAESMPDGRLRTISIDDAVKLHLEGRPWTTGQIELERGKAERDQQARIEQERREKEELAKKEAEDRERKWKESPEYKRQQAELEKKRLAEERAAAEKTKKEREQADALARKQRAEKESRHPEVKQSFRFDTINDVKINLAQCSAAYGFAAGLIKNGTHIPDRNETLGELITLSKRIIDFANRLPGGPAYETADAFYNALIAEHKKIGDRFDRSEKASRLAVDNSILRITKCSDYINNRTVVKMVERYL